MSLLQYFKRAEGRLPCPSGPLSRAMPSTAISSANKLVLAELDKPPMPSQSKRGSYQKYTAEDRALIGKKAATDGIASAMRYFSARGYASLKESSVSTWKQQYLKEISNLKRQGKDTCVKAIESKKRGRPLMLGEEVDKQVRTYLKAFRENGAVVNTAIAMACAEGVIKAHDSNLLECNGGHISLTKTWAKYLMHRMGFVKRRASTKAKVSVSDFEALKAQFIYDIQVVVEMEDIPGELVVNWDQTGIHYVPVSSWTMEKGGSKRVEIAGIDDKRQITAVFAGTLVGDFLPPQLIYQGKTKKSLPSVEFPSNWHVTYTDNHWSNETTMKDYLSSVLLPYIQQKRKELKLRNDYPALVIFDRFKAQCTTAVLDLLRNNHIHIMIVPANCTDRLQPLDVSVNKAAKEFLRRQFQEWYSSKISSQLQAGSTVEAVDLRMAVVKPLSAKWMIALYDYLKSKPDIIKNGFRHAGITAACVPS